MATAYLASRATKCNVAVLTIGKALALGWRVVARFVAATMAQARGQAESGLIAGNATALAKVHWHPFPNRAPNWQTSILNCTEMIGDAIRDSLYD
jgi:hypothetical protein